MSLNTVPQSHNKHTGALISRRFFLSLFSLRFSGDSVLRVSCWRLRAGATIVASKVRSSHQLRDYFATNTRRGNTSLCESLQETSVSETLYLKTRPSRARRYKTPSPPTTASRDTNIILPIPSAIVPTPTFLHRASTTVLSPSPHNDEAHNTSLDRHWCTLGRHPPLHRRRPNLGERN
jgi:hypothetical protein